MRGQDRLDGGVEILLNVRRIRPDSFRRYTLVAENNVAIAAKDVELFQSNYHFNILSVP